MLRGMRAGLAAVRGLPWLWTITLQFTLFNLLLWAPYRCSWAPSPPTACTAAPAPGAISAVYGAGAILGGLVVLGWTRRPRRCWSLPAAATILLQAAPSASPRRPAPLHGGLRRRPRGRHRQRHLRHPAGFDRHPPTRPPEAMSRSNSYVVFGSFSVGPDRLALAGPAATATSIPTVLLHRRRPAGISAALLLVLPAISQSPTDRRNGVDPPRAETANPAVRGNGVSPLRPGSSWARPLARRGTLRFASLLPGPRWAELALSSLCAGTRCCCHRVYFPWPCGDRRLAVIMARQRWR